MAIRRRWLLSVVLAGVMGGVALPARAVATAADFETADAKTMPAMVADILKSLPPETEVKKRDDAAKAVVASFVTPKDIGAINSKRAEARLNLAIMIAGLKTLSSDYALQDMLKAQDPAVRYYGAKGLGHPRLVDLEKQAKSVNTVVGKLSDASKVEKSGVVQQEIIKTLIAYEASDALIDALGSVAGQMETAIPDASTLQMTATALNIVAGKIGSGSDAMKAKAAVNAANLASLAIQQYRFNEKTLKEVEKTVPADYQDGTMKLVIAAGKAASAAVGKTLNTGGGSVDEMELNVNGTFGNPGGTGKQTGIPAPPAIKVPQ